MNPLKHLLLGLLVAGSANVVTAAEAETPIFSFHTTLYETSLDENVFSFSIGASEDTYIDIDFGYGPVEVLVSYADYDSEAGAIQGTAISGSVGPEGTVKVYGDASKIDYLDLEGVYIDQIDISQLTNLEILNLAHNAIGALDLSGHTKLQSVDLSDNTFDVSPLLIGPNKPYLSILTLENVGDLNQSFNLSDYPAMLSFDAYACRTLVNCDPTGCPGLLRLSLDVTNVEKLDVSKNPNLLILNIGETKVTEIDITANTQLSEFYAAHGGSFNGEYQLTSLDLSKNTALTRLHVDGNLFTTLDISNNPELLSVSCARNKLTTLDISNNPLIYSLDVANNYMDFATLPENRTGFSEYYYYQMPMAIDRSYPVGAEIDLSARVLRPSTETYAALFAPSTEDAGAYVELSEEYYTYADGKISILQQYPDSVYLAFANSAYPDYDIKTSKFLIKSVDEYGKDIPTITWRLKPTAKQVDFSIGMLGATPEQPKTFSVDFGDGVPVEFTATSWQAPEVPNVSGAKKGTNMVIYVPEGSDITALAMDNIPLSAIDLDGAPSLRHLSITNCSLGTIGLDWNRCLTTLNLSDNNISTLDLSGADSNNGKNELTDIRAPRNKISEFQLTDGRTPLYIDLADNALTEFDLDNASRLITLDLSGNAITELNLEDCEALENLNISGNNLTELPLPQYTPLRNLDLSGNAIALQDLPLPSAFESYKYAPQQTWTIPEKAPAVNLSEQWIDVDGQTTQYTWYTSEGNRQLTTDEIAGTEGHFHFPDPSVGLVYCTWTHPLFPDFAGDNIYKSSVVEAAPMPTHVVASFTTLVEGTGEIVLTAEKPNTTIYIDWTGLGDLEQYVLTTSYTIFPATAKEGADVKIYSYDEAEGLTVFSLAAGPLAAFDGSAMKGLIAFALYGSYLPQDKIILPDSPDITEVAITNGALTDIDLSQYSKLSMLSLNSNQLTTLDVSKYPNLSTLYAAGNQLTEVKFDNPRLWELSLVGNQLESIDLSGTPAMEQLWLNDNLLSSIDLSSLNKLRILTLSGNAFTLATLPLSQSSWLLYEYADQQPLQVDPIENVVDLSSQAVVGTSQTTYRWFIGSPYYDEAGDLVGEELIEDDEYTLEDGITTFNNSFRNIMCVMTNDLFPDLVLYTNFMDIDVNGIANVAADASGVQFYTSGSSACVAAAPGLEFSLYTTSGVRVAALTTDADGHAATGALTPGIYLARCGDASAKIAIR